ncbi:hypothetical protein FRB90_007583 [Tulasnella sp. 427]|nr:hypothetical protein FRB90_007583 [Tulasnella sp. 427]
MSSSQSRSRRSPPPRSPPPRDRDRYRGRDRSPRGPPTDWRDRDRDRDYRNRSPGPPPRDYPRGPPPADSRYDDRGGRYDRDRERDRDRDRGRRHDDYYDPPPRRPPGSPPRGYRSPPRRSSYRSPSPRGGSYIATRMSDTPRGGPSRRRSRSPLPRRSPSPRYRRAVSPRLYRRGPSRSPPPPSRHSRRPSNGRRTRSPPPRRRSPRPPTARSDRVGSHSRSTSEFGGTVKARSVSRAPPPPRSPSKEGECLTAKDEVVHVKEEPVDGPMDVDSKALPSAPFKRERSTSPAKSRLLSPERPPDHPSSSGAHRSPPKHPHPPYERRAPPTGPRGHGGRERSPSRSVKAESPALSVYKLKQEASPYYRQNEGSMSPAVASPHPNPHQIPTGPSTRTGKPIPSGPRATRAAAPPQPAAPVKTEPEKPKVKDIEIPNRRRDWSYLPGHKEREVLSQKLLSQQRALQDLALEVIKSGWDLDLHAIELEGLKDKREVAEKMLDRASQGLAQDETVDQNPAAQTKPSRSGSAAPGKSQVSAWIYICTLFAGYSTSYLCFSTTPDVTAAQSTFYSAQLPSGILEMDRSPPSTPEQEHRPLIAPPSIRTYASTNELFENVCTWLSRRFGVLGIRGIIITLFACIITNVVVFSGEATMGYGSLYSSTVSRESQTNLSSVLVDWGRVTGSVADGRIVVTGGGGNIGKHMIRRLLASSTPVTVIDKIFHQDELEDIYSDLPKARTLLRVKLGDIRDPEAIKEVMTKDVVGVIHLAAVSRVLWCLENQADCWDVNERGTEVVLDSLADLNRLDKGKRWFVLASSREVYGDAKVFPVEENSEKVPANVYGESKLRAEKVVERFLERVKNDKSTGSIYAIALRLSNVYGGAFDHVERLIPSIVTQALSHQVIQIVGGQQHFDLVHIDDAVDAFLLAVHKLSEQEGVLRLVRMYLQRTERMLGKKINSECGAAAPSIREATELHKLNECEAHVSMDVQGELTILGSPDSTTDNRWHAETKLPPWPVRTFITHNANGDDQLVIREKDQEYYFGIRHNPPPKEGPVRVERIFRKDYEAGDYLEWEMDVNAEEGTMKLILPGFNLQREYQRTSLEKPFLGSPAKTFCDRLTRARRKVQRDLATLSLETLNEPRLKDTTSAPQWIHANLPACSNSCDHPTICVDSGNCQCVLSSCPALQRFPFLSFANLPVLSYPPLQGDEAPSDDPDFNPLLDMVKKSSWLNVLRPQASRFIGTNTPFIKVHVGELHPAEEEWRATNPDAKSMHLLKDAHCFSADTSMESAIKVVMDVSQKDADFVFVPHWQGRTWTHELLHRTYNYSRDHNPYFDPNRVIIPYTHDWGLCQAFEWNVWDMRKTKGLSVSYTVRSTTSWTAMGDLNSPCYRPHQDVVIPPRVCASPKLYEAFENMSKVKPARERSILAAFGGTLWGTGFIDRCKLICRRVDDNKLTDIPNRVLRTKTTLGTLWQTLGNHTYVGALNDTIFCPQPAGTTDWATRLEDSLYAGCIPVFIGESAHHPFFDMIDYSKISISIKSGELNRLEEILLTRYTLADVERMQANIMLVRNAFMYPLDNVPPEEIKQRMLDLRGPLWFALHSTRMKMSTRWPMADVYDRP